VSDRLALNTITIKQETDLRRKIEICAEAGFAGIGMWHDDVSAFEDAGGDVREVKSWVDDLGLTVAEMCFVGGWMYAEQGARKQALELCRRRFRQAQQLDCRHVIACAAGHAGDLAQAISDYADLCDLAADFGVSPALEFLGGAQQVKDVRTAWEIVRRADRPNGSVLLDTFHFHVGGSKAEHLLDIPGERIGLVHANDAPAKEGLTDSDRVFCGKGAFPLVPIFATLFGKGFTGWISLELFNAGYWERDPADVAAEGLETLEAVVSKAC
jgi:sugar phosphate isomerase/epimerase